MAKGRKPTHSVKVYDADREEDKGRYVGVGWSTANGKAIQIKLDAGIAIHTMNARIVVYERDEKEDDDRDSGRGRRRRDDDDRPGRRYD